MEDKENPNSHECLRRDTSHSWSDLPLDLLSLVFERLSFTNFRRAKSVCSSWYSASKQSVPTKNQIHWLILFPEAKKKNNNSCMLFNPEEKQHLYKTHDLGLEFAKSVCIATYKSWFLMQDSQYDLFIMNLFTRERIDLPSVELFWNDYKLRRGFANLGSKYIEIRYPVFWIDDKTKDYIVLWGLKNWCVVYSKKGDTLWNEIQEISDCRNMVYKDHKLYILSYHGIFKIFDFSGEIPQETFQCDFLVGLDLFIPYRLQNSTVFHTSHLVVTVTGEVLKVEKWWTQMYKTLSFRVFKIYSSGLIMKKPKLIKSLGNESILLDQGITVLVKDNDRLTRNSIYLSGTCDCEKNIFHYNLKTQKTVRLHTFDNPSFNFSRSKWFVPCFTHTLLI